MYCKECPCKDVCQNKGGYCPAKKIHEQAQQIHDLEILNKVTVDTLKEELDRFKVKNEKFMAERDEYWAERNKYLWQRNYMMADEGIEKELEQAYAKYLEHEKTTCIYLGSCKHKTENCPMQCPPLERNKKRIKHLQKGE